VTPYSRLNPIANIPMMRISFAMVMKKDLRASGMRAKKSSTAAHCRSCPRAAFPDGMDGLFTRHPFSSGDPRDGTRGREP
jgi:hypothetical protein